ncbi:MAG: amidohydrolase family protein [Acidimicrobiales bacterium]
MLDLVLAGGTLIDGTGAPAVVADVGLRDGRVVEVGTITEPTRRRLDVAGRVVAPGFIDPHTHYDAQLMWDPAATPSSLHGVTTVIGGNCGFTLAPVATAAASVDETRDNTTYLQRMMARVEGMPLAALEQGLAWDWRSFAEYLDRFEGAIGVNAGFLVGHSAIRRAVMGPAATQRNATAEEVSAIVAEFHAALRAGALGLSTSLSTTHNDGENDPVPSRLSSDAELFALTDALRGYRGTTLEFITTGCINGFTDDEIELMIELSSRADRPLNWNVLSIDPARPQLHEHQLSASDRANARGARIVALAMPIVGPSRVCFHDYFALYSLPKWKDIFPLPIEQRTRFFADADERRELDAIATGPGAGALRGLASWANLEIGETFAPGNAGLAGRLVRDVAAERRQDAWDVVCDLAVADGLRTIFWTTGRMAPASARQRVDTLRDPRVLIGGSDAGAHLDRMCGARYPTKFLASYVREAEAIALEEAVHLLTEVPARYFGLRDRGTIAVGHFADLVVFDAATVDADRIVTVADLPGGADRLTSQALGIDYVLVNGDVLVDHGATTDARSGTLLRAGRDT